MRGVTAAADIGISNNETFSSRDETCKRILLFFMQAGAPGGFRILNNQRGGGINGHPQGQRGGRGGGGVVPMRNHPHQQQHHQHQQDFARGSSVAPAPLASNAPIRGVGGFVPKILRKPPPAAAGGVNASGVAVGEAAAAVAAAKPNGVGAPLGLATPKVRICFQVMAISCCVSLRGCELLLE